MNQELQHTGQRIPEKVGEGPEALEPLLGGPPSKLKIKSTEETLAELRRENFRLRLICFDYEKARKRRLDPEDADSSKLFSLEAENLGLKEVIAEKTGLLRSASKMIDTLKEENDSFREQLTEARNRFEENERIWQEKYDTLYAELQQARHTVRLNDVRLISIEMESNREKNELRSQISELQNCLETSEAERESRLREISMVRSEAARLRAALDQLTGDASLLDGTQVALQNISQSLHLSCQERLEEVASMTRALIHQITDAGLTPIVPCDSVEYLSSGIQACSDGTNRKPLSELTQTSNQPESQKNVLKIVEGVDAGTSIASLNTTRRQVLELNSQKSRQDTLIAELRCSHELLNQRVAELLEQLNDQMLAREQLVVDADQAREQAQRLQREQRALRDQFAKELKEKERTIERLNLVLSVLNGAGDVTQHTFHEDNNSTWDVHDTATREAAGPGASTSRMMLPFKDDEDNSLVLQMLPPTTHSGVFDGPEHGRRRSATFTLDAPSTDHLIQQMASVEPAPDSANEVEKLQNELIAVRSKLSEQTAAYARLKKAYDVLVDSAHIGSLASEAVTSLDGTKDIGRSPSALGSLADLPTVSTPPNHMGSPLTYPDDATNPEQLLDEDGKLPHMIANLSSPEISCTTLDADDIPAGGQARPSAKSNDVRLASQSMVIPPGHGDGSELPTNLMTRPVSAKPGLNLSLPGLLEPASADRVPHNTPARESPAHPEPVSLARLRDLYNLVHGLKVQLDNVRFTQHSFVEMVNRSLGTSGLDMSVLFTPSKSCALVLPEQLTDDKSLTLDVSHAGPDSVTRDVASGNSRLSTTTMVNTTGTTTVPQSTNGPQQQAQLDADKSFESVLVGGNQTLSELRAYPSSPTAESRGATTGSHPGGSRSAIPVFKASRSHPKFPLSRVQAVSQQLAAASTSFTEGMRPSSRLASPARSRVAALSRSFTGDLTTTPSLDNGGRPTGLGDLTMVEWQNNDLFERLARATAKLRDALEECAECVGSQLWTEDVSLCLSQLCLHESQVPTTATTTEPPVPISTEAQPTPPDHPIPTTAIAEPIANSLLRGADPTPGVNRSVRFDRIDPHLAPPDFAQLSADSASLSQPCAGSVWPLPESSWSEKAAAGNVSADAQTSTSKAPVTRGASEASTDPTSSSPVYMLHRFVSLLTHALTVLHRAAVPRCTAADEWLASWTQSATHWFQSYVDAMPSSELASAVNSITRQSSDKEDLDCLLECLERVFNQHIDHWVAETKRRFAFPQEADSDSQRDTAHVLSELTDAKERIEKLLTDNRVLEKQCEQLRNQLDSVSDKNEELASSECLLGTSTRSLLSLSADERSKSILLGRGCSKRAAKSTTSSAPVPETKQLDLILDSIRSAGYPVPSGYSPKDCIEALLMDWRLAKDDRESMASQLKSMVPRDAYSQVQDDLTSARTAIETLRHELDSQRAYIGERLRLVELDVQGEDAVDCVDQLLAELTKTRTCLAQLEVQNTQLQSRLESSVPRLDLEQKQHQLDILTADLEQLRSHLDAGHQMIDHVITTFGSLAPSTVTRSADSLTDWIAVEFAECQRKVEHLTDEHRDTIRFLSEFTGVDENGVMLTELLEFVKQTYQDFQEELDRLRTERNQVVTAFHAFGLMQNEGDDDDNLTDHVESLLSTLVDKQQALLELEETCDQVREQLNQSVPMQEHAKLQNDLSQVRANLANTEARIAELEQALDQAMAQPAVCDHETLVNELSQQLVAQQSQFGQLRSILLDASSGSSDDLVELAGSVVGQLCEHKQLTDHMKSELATSVEERQCWQQKFEHVTADLANLTAEHDAQLADLHAKSKELDEIRSLNDRLTQALHSKQSECDHMSEELREAQQDISALRSTLAAKTSAAEAAAAASLAQEDRANELAEQLESLRAQFHARTTRMVSAQTSPVAGKSRSAEELLLPTDRSFTAGSAEQPETGVNVERERQQSVSSRARKYGELKAVAFEIKDKLIRRTEKLEAALTEVARLRSVIQQDKEHASRVLEEVEDLRRQAIRKNRKIHELETELSRLKSHPPGATATGDPQPVSDARHSHSSGRTISDFEQPRGAHCRGAPLSSNMPQILNGSLCAELINDPVTPSIRYAEFERELAPQINSSSLLVLPDGSSAYRSTPDRLEVSSTVPDLIVDRGDRGIAKSCQHCGELQALVASLQNLSAELQRRVESNLNEEYSLLTTLEQRYPHDESAADPATVEDDEEASMRVPSQSMSHAIQAPTLYGPLSRDASLNDLKLNIQSLQHARSRLGHYAAEMDRMCSAVMQRIHRTADGDEQPFKQAYAALRSILGQSHQSLDDVYHQLKSLLLEIAEPHRSIIKHLARSVRHVIRGLAACTSDRSLSSPNGSENQENVAPRLSGSDATESRAKQHQLIRRAERYRRRYEDLARGLDAMTRDLSETTNVLSAARSNLERTTGLSSFSPNQTPSRP